MTERLQKFLARSGIGSRRFCEELIKSEKIKVNNKIAIIGKKVSSEDIVEYDGKVIQDQSEPLRVLLLNKPEGVLSSSKREKKIPIIFDYLPKNEKNSKRWISIGRLDINTSGLMLFTNDGDFANYCMHPSSNIDREYLVRARGIFTNEKKQKLLEGISIDGENFSFSDLVEGQKNSSNQWFSVCLHSGKNREVRKLFESVEMEVSRLKRTRFGPIFLPSTLKKGRYIELQEEDIFSLREYGTYQGI
tara:strand:- start:2670 stop:3410 length:741 start_codon:yes stop_codon:yes gene_type:complete